MSCSTTPRVPASLIGIPPATLQTWLAQAQQAMHELQTGAKIVTASYNQGDGSAKSVTYNQASMVTLRAYLNDLLAALGTPRRRRAIGVRFP